MAVRKVVEAVKEQQINDAPRQVLEDLFEDYYKNRKQIYLMNLWRGIFFGFGSIIGGTIFVALLLWTLSIFHYIPFLNGVVDAAQHSLEQRNVK